MIPQDAEPANGDLLPEVYDPWCFYGYGLNEVIGFPTSVEGTFPRGGLRRLDGRRGFGLAGRRNVGGGRFGR